MILSTFGEDRYTVGEKDVVLGHLHSFNGTQPNGVIYCHGAGDTAASAFGKTAQLDVMTKSARHATVHVGDLAYNAFGNDLDITRVGEAVTYLRAEWGQDGPVVLVGASMGVVSALVYALQNPTEVLAVAGIIPGLDLASLHSLSAGTGIPAMIDAAYPPAYNDATDGPTHSPVQFAADLPADLPIHLWTSSNDDRALPATADAFIAARPQTGRTNLGALGHTEAAIAASAAGVRDFVEQFTYPL